MGVTSSRVSCPFCVKYERHLLLAGSHLLLPFLFVIRVSLPIHKLQLVTFSGPSKMFPLFFGFELFWLLCFKFDNERTFKFVVKYQKWTFSLTFNVCKVKGPVLPKITHAYCFRLKWHHSIPRPFRTISTKNVHVSAFVVIDPMYHLFKPVMMDYKMKLRSRVSTCMNYYAVLSVCLSVHGLGQAPFQRLRRLCTSLDGASAHHKICTAYLICDAGYIRGPSECQTRCRAVLHLRALDRKGNGARIYSFQVCTSRR
jgi:hypothetical protein